MEDFVRVVEVGPRDGLQNEPSPASVPERVAFVEALFQAGLEEIEVGSCVSPKRVPQMAGTREVLASTPAGVLASVLVPNLRGLADALEWGAKRIAVFASASEEFSVRNLGRSRGEAMAEFAEVVREFRAARSDGWVRGYLSMAFVCPFEGPTSPEVAALATRELLAIGCDEVAISDTIGAGVPREVSAIAELLSDVPCERIAWHFHDTRGIALANVSRALDLGFRRFDAAAGGLGGCPFAPGAGGNLATERLVYFLERSGYRCGVNPELLARASSQIREALAARAPSQARAKNPAEAL